MSWILATPLLKVHPEAIQNNQRVITAYLGVDEDA
jgi:ABC-type branched-subunit amino acid transport system ATPase component